MDHEFRFSLHELPVGAALTASELEEELLAALRRTNGTCIDTLYSLAALYQRTAHFSEASECIEQALKHSDDPETRAACFLALGQLDETQDEYESAARNYRRAFSLEPMESATWYFIHNNLGYSLNQLADHASAVPYLERAIQIDNQRPNAYKNLGLAHQSLGNYEDAAAMFVQSTKVDATDGRSLEHLESLLEARPELKFQISDLEEQLEACRKAVEYAKSQQPDIVAHWNRLRAQQAPKWWQFWRWFISA